MISIAPYPWHRLPRISHNARRCLIRLKDHLSVGGETRTRLERWARDCLGCETIRLDVVAARDFHRDELRAPDGLTYEVTASSGSSSSLNARITIDDGLARFVLCRLMGIPSSKADLAFAYQNEGFAWREGESAMVAYALAWLLAELSLPTPWRINPIPVMERNANDAVQDDHVLVETRVVLDERCGNVWLCLPFQTWTNLPRHRPVSHLRNLDDRVSHLRVSANIVVDVIPLMSTDLLRLREGDLVLFSPTIGPNQKPIVNVRCGSICVSAEVSMERDRYRLTLVSPQGVPTMSVSTNANRESQTTLEDVPIEITIELGRIAMPLRALVELSVGDVLNLMRPTDGVVDLYAGGTLWARGKLVDVEGETGVLIESMLARSLDEGSESDQR